MKDENLPVVVGPISTPNLVNYKDRFSAGSVAHSPGCRCIECLPHIDECNCLRCREKNRAGNLIGNIVPQLHNVFVYGTLKDGFGNHDTYLKGCKQIAKDVWLEDHALISLDTFPAMYSHYTLRVMGEVYEVSDKTLKSLDILEGVNGGLYFRKRAELKIDSQTRVYCYTYCQLRPVRDYKRVVSGIWIGNTSATIDVHPVEGGYQQRSVYVPPPFQNARPQERKGINPGVLLWGIPNIDTGGLKFKYSNGSELQTGDAF